MDLRFCKRVDFMFGASRLNLERHFVRPAQCDPLPALPYLVADGEGDSHHAAVVPAFQKDRDRLPGPGSVQVIRQFGQHRFESGVVRAFHGGVVIQFGRIQEHLRGDKKLPGDRREVGEAA